ncbi:MAG: hypothetical protein AABX29_00685 [Nanoarchaeota archaeon]
MDNNKSQPLELIVVEEHAPLSRKPAAVSVNTFIRFSYWSSNYLSKIINKLDQLSTHLETSQEKYICKHPFRYFLLFLQGKGVGLRTVQILESMKEMSEDERKTYSQLGYFGPSFYDTFNYLFEKNPNVI